MVDILISDELKEILEDIKTESVVASLLLKGSHNPEDLVENHVNYISIGSHDRTKISYLTQERISTLTDGEFWRTGRRYQGKPGAFVSKLFKNIDSREIEKFSTLFRNQSNKLNFTFKVVAGEEIRKWYKYETNASPSGTLGASCMKHDFCQPFLNIYTENSCVSMLIMLNNDSMLLGRALLWDFDSHKIMDRIYTVSDEEYQFYFKQWATKNNYFYKTQQNWYNTLFFEKIGESKQEMKLEVTLPSFRFSKYPYMDTFKFINTSNGKLFNYMPDDLSYVKTLCSSDGGRYEGDYLRFDDIDRVLRHRGDCVYLDYLDCYTTSANCSYSEINDQYILNKDAFYDEELRDYLFSAEHDDKNRKDRIQKRRDYIKAENERLEKMRAARKEHPASNRFRDTIERYISTMSTQTGADFNRYVNELLSEVSTGQGGIVEANEPVEEPISDNGIYWGSYQSYQYSQSEPQAEPETQAEPEAQTEEVMDQVYEVVTQQESSL